MRECTVSSYARGCRPRTEWGFDLRPVYAGRDLWSLKAARRTRGLPGVRLRSGERGRRGRSCYPRPRGLDALGEADTIIVPGLADPAEPIPEDVLEALGAAAAGGTRIASICVGAFILAAAGLLNGLRATTHWAAARELSRLDPAVDVDADVLFVDSGQILTSAGAAAGLDLCLHMIRRDHGSAVAADAARTAAIQRARAA
jgi:transcriptional regulator GlxA family with amidase domain